MDYRIDRLASGRSWGRKFLVAIGATVLCASSAINAQEPSLLPVVDDNVASGVDGASIELELQRLQQQIDDLRVGALAPIACCPEPTAKPTFPKVRLTGFFHADAVWFDQDPKSRVTLGNGVASAGDIQDGADFRRARLAAVGQAWDNVSYMLEMDFAFPGRPSFMDVWLDIDDVLGSNNLRIGQFRQPFGMDGQTGVKDLTFFERAIPFAFPPFRQIGAMLHGQDRDEVMTWAVSGFRYPTDTFGANIGDNGGYGLATRVTGLLVNSSQGLVHLGGGYSFIDPSNDLFQFRSQPEVAVSETGGGVPAGVLTNVPAFVDTGAFAANNSNLFNAEFAAACGAFHTQSEVYYTVVDRQDQSTLTFMGAYAQAGYVLTGESRDYNTKNGVFGRVKPSHNFGKGGGLGAWEIAGRWSYLDLNDNDIQGGRLNNLTAGLNWYLNPYTKFQMNYIYAMLDNPIYGDSDTGIYAMRAQVVF